MWHWLERYRGPIILFLLALLLGGGAFLFYRQFTTSGAIEISLASPEQIEVQVSGGVASPGSYTLPSGARVANAIKAAGGFTADAYLGGLNLTQELDDGDQIHVLSTGVLSKVNINTASASQLETLPGIGPVKAQNIVAYRIDNGPFLSKEELQNVSGIGEQTYDDLKDKITVY